MKIKKIAAICTKTKWVELRDVMTESGDTIQWVGNGSAMYRIDGVPYLGKTSVMTLLDIPQSKRADFGQIHEEIGYDHGLHDDMNDEDVMVMPLDFSFEYLNGKASAFQSLNGKVHLVNTRHLSPLGEEADLWERRIGKATYLVAKEGFLACAIIKPYEPPKGLLEQLKTVAKGVEIQVHENEEMEMDVERELDQKPLYEAAQEPLNFEEGE